MNEPIATLPGTVRYVATNGSDTSGDGTMAMPLATIARAHAMSSAGDSIVVRGGTYREGGITVTKTVTITAYPGEIPIFDGAVGVTDGFVADGDHRYIPYTPIPVSDGSGILFSQNQNLSASTSYVGKYPDQLWIDDTELRQVDSLTAVTNDSFYVDRTNRRLYMTAVNAAKNGIAVSSLRTFMSIRAPDVTLRGMRVVRYSNAGGDAGVINVTPTGDRARIEHVEIVDASFISVFFQGSTDLNQNSTLRHATIRGANWMGVSATYTDDLTLEAVKITKLNRFGEFTFSPQSGALKTSRTRRTRIVGNLVTDNNSHGLWFDQSNLDVDVAHSMLEGNAGTAVFFEISDDFTLIDCEVRSTGDARAVKLAGSSGLKLVNNTIVGGADPVGIYVDSRSIAGCADPSKPLCGSSSYTSERDTVRPYVPTIDWIPKLDLLLNNVIVSPTSNGYCASRTALCITERNEDALVPINTILHLANPALGIPQTRMDGNVYSNGTGDVIDTSIGKYASVDAFTTAMAKAPVGLSGLEQNGRHGSQWVQPDGTPTAALSAEQALAIPTDAKLNRYLPAGTRHFGATWR